jgi:hypothetical protein
MTKRKSGTGVLAVGVAVSLCLLASGAVAGYKANYPVSISTSSRTMSGALGSIRNTSDTVQVFQCATYQGTGGSPWAYCSATDASGNNASCSTTSPNLVQQINALNGDSYVYVYWNTDGSCGQIAAYVGSDFAPKAP